MVAGTRFSTPEELYAELFQQVQSKHIFLDSKTFVDAVPKTNPEEILRRFRDRSSAAGFDLKRFVLANFDLPDEPDGPARVAADRPIREHIELQWDALTRTADIASEHSTLIALPQPYVVPGGRFREVYYWDTYFTMLGLAAAGRQELVECMVDNFAYLIDLIGFVPNGNRTYYCTRSQPPYFALMVELLAELAQDPAIFVRYLPSLEREYAFWMAGSDNDRSRAGGAWRRTVTARGGLLNRYWDDANQPRQESFAEDVALAARCRRESGALYRDIRAACESGWDFSSRWLADGHSMAAIATSEVVPVDLNVLMWKLEDVLATAHTHAHDQQRADLYRRHADRRMELLQTLFFDHDRGVFADLSLPDLVPTGRVSLATAFPLFFGLARRRQAARVAESIHREFLRPGGWVTTRTQTGQQWDAPNGWAPLQWIVYCGMRNAGHAERAVEGARRWVDNNLRVYRQQGCLLEKYNVEEPDELAGGGEYAVQDGFGWTNGVLLRLMDELGIEAD